MQNATCGPNIDFSKAITFTPNAWRAVADRIRYFAQNTIDLVLAANHDGSVHEYAASVSSDITIATCALHYIADFCADDIHFTSEEQA
ncbi:hypothetical protein AGMMS49992_26750 [Clostridia bacterium]|nr:hypothetical protein AGMMS49992_26750 [Clostridia bacterium]